MLLDIKKITKRFKSGNQTISVLNEVNFQLQEGMSVALLGRSGSGKSTFLNLLAGLDSPDSGEVFFNGVGLNRLSEAELAVLRGQHIGFVFQTFRLLEALNALENVCLPLELLNKPHVFQTGMEWLSRLGLKDRAHHFPSQLSGGEQQRVAIARALIHRPKLLIADEPTGNLDYKTGEEVGDLLFSLSKNSKIALVLATHDVSLAKRASLVIELFQGQFKKVSV
jgi:putative ABC transport system ATP-binding protein